MVDNDVTQEKSPVLTETEGLNPRGSPVLQAILDKQVSGQELTVREKQTLNLAKSPINLWQKGGPSPNPRGRPKKIVNALDKALTPRKLKALANGIITQAAKGDVAAFKEIADRVDGPVARPITGEDGGPMQIEIVTRLIGQK